jgi:N utilization substance protein B
MTRRSRAREVALQLLFQRDLNPNTDRAAIERFAGDRLRDPALAPFCLSLYDGVVAHLSEIDEALTAAADNWRLPRMAAVDRNILRLGSYELRYSPDSPPHVALDEAIELARRYGSAGSPAFVNGVLDRVHKGEGGRGKGEDTAEGSDAKTEENAGTDCGAESAAPVPVSPST